MKRAAAGVRAATLVAALLFLAPGCVTDPVLALAQRHGMSQEVWQGSDFSHRVIRGKHAGTLLHVYIEGDGRPWLTPRRLAPDPTPRDPLMLRLMAIDAAPVVYLGRPCYFRVRDPRCSAQWWTTHRYAPEIVASLNAALDRIAGQFQGVVLIGHSGGGALAMLMAARRHDVRAVVTIAGNLDIEAWARHHGYSALAGSLDPADQEALPTTILQRHYLGANDKVVTGEMLREALAAQNAAPVRVEPGIGHACCWEGIWMRILEDLERTLAASRHEEEFTRLVPGVTDG